MKIATYFSQAPQRGKTPIVGKLATIKELTKEATLRTVGELAAPGPSFGEAYDKGMQHGLTIAFREILPQASTPSGLSMPQLSTLRLLRVAMDTSRPVQATEAPLPRSTGWVRVGAALGVKQGAELVVWTWALPASMASKPSSPTSSATTSDGEWEDA